MKKWWQKSIVELWRDLFANEKTRPVAVVLFIALVGFQNWVVVRGIMKAETLDYFGLWLHRRFHPIEFSAWFILNIVLAVFLDALFVGAVIFVWRESKRRRHSDPST